MHPLSVGVDGFEPPTYILFFSIFTLLIISVLLYGFIVQFLIVWHKTDAFYLLCFVFIK